MKTPANRTAAMAYEEHRTAALELVARIATPLKNAERLRNPNWANVGDMERYRRTLQELSDLINGEGEFAPEPKPATAWSNALGRRVTIPE